MGRTQSGSMSCAMMVPNPAVDGYQSQFLQRPQQPSAAPRRCINSGAHWTAPGVALFSRAVEAMHTTTRKRGHAHIGYASNSRSLSVFGGSSEPHLGSQSKRQRSSLPHLLADDAHDEPWQRLDLRNVINQQKAARQKHKSLEQEQSEQQDMKPQQAPQKHQQHLSCQDAAVGIVPRQRRIIRISGHTSNSAAVAEVTTVNESQQAQIAAQHQCHQEKQQPKLLKPAAGIRVHGMTAAPETQCIAAVAAVDAKGAAATSKLSAVVCAGAPCEPSTARQHYPVHQDLQDNSITQTQIQNKHHQQQQQQQEQQIEVNPEGSLSSSSDALSAAKVTGVHSTAGVNEQAPAAAAAAVGAPTVMPITEQQRQQPRQHVDLMSSCSGFDAQTGVSVASSAPHAAVNPANTAVFDSKLAYEKQGMLALTDTSKQQSAAPVAAATAATVPLSPPPATAGRVSKQEQKQPPQPQPQPQPPLVDDVLSEPAGPGDGAGDDEICTDAVEESEHCSPTHDDDNDPLHGAAAAPERSSDQDTQQHVAISSGTHDHHASNSSSSSSDDDDDYMVFQRRRYVPKMIEAQQTSGAVPVKQQKGHHLTARSSGNHDPRVVDTNRGGSSGSSRCSPVPPPAKAAKAAATRSVVEPCTQQQNNKKPAKQSKPQQQRQQISLPAAAAASQQRSQPLPAAAPVVAAAVAVAVYDADDADNVDVAAAVSSAGIAVLPRAAAVLRNGSSERDVDPSQYHWGDKILKRAKLFIKSPQGVWQQMSKSCHDCQEQHVNYKCQEKGCRGVSVCNNCLVRRYHGLHSLAALHTKCPVCRGECTCRNCLRKADHNTLLPRPRYSQQQQHRFGVYMLMVLGPLLATFMKQQDQECISWGYAAGLSSVPRHPLSALDRLLCDRCGTQVVGLVAHCSQCDWDCCCSCAAALRKHCQQTAAAAADGGGGRGVSKHRSKSLRVTCCNPGCPSVAGQSVRSAVVAAHEEVVRGDLVSHPAAAELSLEAVLPQDLIHKMDRLQQLAQKWQSPDVLKLQMCPLLPTSAASSLTGPSGRPLTLKQLQEHNWWTYLPAHLRDPWRRRVTSSRWMFTPHINDFTADGGDGDGQAGPQQQQQQQRSHLALAVFWSRWQLGEPIIVRGVTGRLKWDPATLRRAVRDIKADRAKRSAHSSNSVSRKKSVGSRASSSDDTGPDRPVDDDVDSDDSDGGRRVWVMDCEDFSKTEVTEHQFFMGYKQGHQIERMCSDGVVRKLLAMLKVKDWPPRSQLTNEMQRHYVDFLQALPVRDYTDPRLNHSPLNLASALKQSDNPTDLGPKCYVAYGRVQEADGEGDSVTKLHVDMADAVNMLLHTHPGADPAAQAAAAAKAAGQVASRCGEAAANKPSYDGAGAVWDICPRGDSVQRLSRFLSRHASEFTHQGEPVSADDDPLVDSNPVFTQQFMLVERHRKQLAAEEGLELWHFEQHLGEVVFIPGGCPHQVRNLQSCCKIAVDFVSPESMAAALQNREQLRVADLSLEQPLGLGPEDRRYQEKLQSQLMLLRGVLRADELVTQR